MFMLHKHITISNLSLFHNLMKLLRNKGNKQVMPNYTLEVAEMMLRNSDQHK